MCRKERILLTKYELAGLKTVYRYGKIGVSMLLTDSSQRYLYFFAGRLLCKRGDVRRSLRRYIQKITISGCPHFFTIILLPACLINGLLSVYLFLGAIGDKGPVEFVFYKTQADRGVQAGDFIRI